MPRHILSAGLANDSTPGVDGTPAAKTKHGTGPANNNTSNVKAMPAPKTKHLHVKGNKRSATLKESQYSYISDEGLHSPCFTTAVNVASGPMDVSVNHLVKYICEIVLMQLVRTTGCCFPL